MGHSNVWGETALHTTMRRAGPETADRLGIVRYLLKHGARAVCRDENGLTPLMLAAKRGFRQHLNFNTFSFSRQQFGPAASAVVVIVRSVD